jgi:hypothetical protein
MILPLSILYFKGIQFASDIERAPLMALRELPVNSDEDFE